MLFKKSYDIAVVIEGMSCSYCSARVEQALNNIKGVTANVDLKKNTAFIKCEGEVDRQDIRQAIYDAGYKVVKMR